MLENLALRISQKVDHLTGPPQSLGFEGRDWHWHYTAWPTNWSIALSFESKIYIKNSIQ